MSEFNVDDYDDQIIERSKLTKNQLWKHISKESAYDYLNEKKSLSYHFIKSIYENDSIKSRRDSFFEKRSELDIKWTIQMFNEREKKFRTLIYENPLIRTEHVVDLIDVVLSEKTVGRRVDAFFSANKNQTNCISRNDFLFLEKQHRDYIIENRDLPIEKLAEKLIRWDKRKIILKIKNIELDETYKRIKKMAKNIPLEREKRKESKMIAQGKGKIIKGASGKDRFVENDPKYVKWIFAGVFALIFYLVFKDMPIIETEQDKWCKKYYKNYPLATREDCDRSWKQLKEYSKRY